jgi:hypothetical protein
VLPAAFDEGPAEFELDDEQALASRPAVTSTVTATRPWRRRFGVNTGPTVGDGALCAQTSADFSHLRNPGPDSPAAAAQTASRSRWLITWVTPSPRIVTP